MNTRTHTFFSARTQREDRGGIALIGMIAVVAVIAIFALVILSALLRQVDHEVSRAESATLKAQKEALERTILRNAYIPAPTNWVEAVASELGMDAAKVSINPRRQPRFLLVDTGGWLTNVTLAYTQTVVGAAAKPVNARMMLVSSLGQSPPSLGNYPAASEFAALWNCREGQVPTGGSWAGWNGRPDDIKVERIHLDPLFVELRLVTGKSEPGYGLFSIGAATPTNAAPRQQVSNPPRYILQGTEVWLYTDVTNGAYLDAHLILTKNAFYRYENGVWKASAVGAELPGGLDLALVVKGFLDATPNTNAFNRAAQQGMVVDSMMDYMRGYNAWAAAGFPNNAMKTQLENIQDAMMLKCQQLFQFSGGGNNYYPINQGACQ